jgi:hypothetical protein
MKIRPVGAELSHVDERTGMTKLTVAFRNFAKEPKSNETGHGVRYEYYYSNPSHDGNMASLLHYQSSVCDGFGHIFKIFIAYHVRE